MSEENKYLAPFNQLKSDITDLVAPVLTIDVKDFPSCQTAAEAAKQIKDLQKRIQTTRRALVDPLNKQVKAINDYAKSIEEPLLEAEAHIKRQLIKFDNEQEKIREAEKAQVRAEQAAKEAEIKAAHDEKLKLAQEAAEFFGGGLDVAAIEEQKAQALAVNKSETLGKEYDIAQMGIKNARKVWKCELVDINLVPKEFLIITLNEKAVLSMAREGVTEIPGVRIWQDKTIAIGANTYVPRAALKSGR